jgi:hypothetical protein
LIKLSKRTIDLNKTTIKSAMKIMMAEAEVGSLADLARKLDIKETTFRSSINNGSIRLADFMKAAHEMGYTVIVRSSEE